MVTCNECGTENKGDAAFCSQCGNSLAPLPAQPSMPIVTSSPSDNPMMTKAIIAILLNFFLLWGLGYWYLGLKTVYGQNWYMLIVAQVVVIILSMFIPFVSLLYLLISLAMVYDLYEKASGRPGIVPIKAY